jgi:hypothetical protein
MSDVFTNMHLDAFLPQILVMVMVFFRGSISRLFNSERRKSSGKYLYNRIIFVDLTSCFYLLFFMNPYALKFVLINFIPSGETMLLVTVISLIALFLFIHLAMEKEFQLR